MLFILYSPILTLLYVEATSENSSDAASEVASDAAANSPVVEPSNVLGDPKDTTLSFIRRDSLDELISTC